MALVAAISGVCNKRRHPADHLEAQEAGQHEDEERFDQGEGLFLLLRLFGGGLASAAWPTGPPAGALPAAVAVSNRHSSAKRNQRCMARSCG